MRYVMAVATRAAPREQANLFNDNAFSNNKSGGSPEMFRPACAAALASATTCATRVHT